MKAQAYVVSLYAAGERRPSDCYPDFLARRIQAEEAGQASLRDSGVLGSLAWAARFTVRRIWLDQE